MKKTRYFFVEILPCSGDEIYNEKIDSFFGLFFSMTCYIMPDFTCVGVDDFY